MATDPYSRNITAFNNRFNQFRERAIAAGYGEDEINSFRQQAYLPYLKQSRLEEQQVQPVNKTQPLKKKGFWTDQISTGGGIGGALTGAAIGGAVGSVPGALAGAIIGGFGGGAGGQRVENEVVGEEDKMKDVWKEGAINGAFAVGPIRGANVALQGGRALLRGAGGTGVKDAVEQAATATPIRNAITGRTNSAANALQRGVTGTGKVADSFTQENQILDTINRRGLKGSASKLYQNVDPELGRISDEISTTLSGITKTAPRKSVFETLQKSASEALPADPAYARELTRSLSRISAGSGNTVGPQELFGFKQELGNRLGTAFKKLNRGAPLTTKEEVDMALWKNLDSQVTKLAPEVKQLTLDQSNLITARPGFKKGSEYAASVPFAQAKSKSLGQAIQKTQYGTAAALKAGSGVKLPGTPLGPVRTAGRMATGDYLTNAILPSEPAPNMENEQDLSSASQAPSVIDDYIASNEIDQSGGVTNPFGVSREEIAQQMILALQAGDKTGFSQFKDIYDAIGEYEKAQGSSGSMASQYGKPTASQYSQGRTAMSSVDQLEQLLSSDPGAVDRGATPGQSLPVVGGLVSALAGSGQYRTLTNNILNSVARINTGANMPASEEAFYRSTYLPQPGDNEATRKAKLANLREFFSPIVNYTGSGDTSLEEALMSAQQGGGF